MNSQAVEDQARVGVGLYSAPSLLNHSCRPNTLQLFNGRHLLLKALRDIGPGEQLFITYTETLQLHSERQAKLQSGYNFTCACERCLEDISQSPVSVVLYYNYNYNYYHIVFYHYRDVLTDCS